MAAGQLSALCSERGETAERENRSCSGRGLQTAARRVRPLLCNDTQKVIMHSSNNNADSPLTPTQQYCQLITLFA